MLRYIISTILLLASLQSQAQLFEPLEAGRQPFIRLSIDPTIPLKSYLQSADISGFETTIDSEVLQNIFATAGYGQTKMTHESDILNYTNSGAFFTLGINLNLTQYLTPQDRDIFFIGVHYGYSTFTHEVPSFSISNELGNYSSSFPSERANASWVEVAMGAKAEIAQNIFIGWNGEVKLRTHLSPTNNSPFYIPGFGDTESQSSFDFNIFLSYAFSFKAKAQTTPINNEVITKR